jgi:hypothetical protein
MMYRASQAATPATPAVNYYLITAQEQSLLSSDMPTASDITAAFNSAQFQGTDAWVGPSPRITRAAAPPYFVTSVAWLVSVSGDPTTQAQNLANYQVQITNALNSNSSGWGGVNQLPYDPVTNGPTDWWQSGQAAATATQNTYQSVSGQVIGSVENPVGPGTSTPSVGTQVGVQLHDLVTGAITGGSNAPPGGPSTLSSATTLLTVGAAIVVGGVVLWFAWPLLGLGRRAEVAAVQSRTRRNPYGRRRRRHRHHRSF